MERSDLVKDDDRYVDRREALGYIGTGGFGMMVGYYVGAKGLLGSGSTETPANDENGDSKSTNDVEDDENEHEPSMSGEDESETSTEDRTEAETDDESGTSDYRTDFADGLDGWTVGLHSNADSRVSPGEGEWTEQHGGSVHLHVRGGPNHVGVYRTFDGLEEGMTIRARYESPNLRGEPGGPRILLHTSDGESTQLDRDPGGGGDSSPDTDGLLEGTVPEDIPDGTDVEIRLGVWPGDIDVYVTQIVLPDEGVVPA